MVEKLLQLRRTQFLAIIRLRDSLTLNHVLHPLSFSILYLAFRRARKKGVKRGSMTKQEQRFWCSPFVFGRDFETTKVTWSKKKFPEIL
jgi:hypothetical protein